MPQGYGRRCRCCRNGLPLGFAARWSSASAWAASRSWIWHQRMLRQLRGKSQRGSAAMPVKIDRLQPEGMNVRMQQGKAAYSHVVTVSGPAKTVYIAGQLARDAEGNIVGPGDMRAQLEQ